MSEILLYYKRPDPTTWVYMSSFLTIGLYFVFHRFWSVRNLDVILLILLAPGLLMVYEGRRRQLVESEAVAQRFRMEQDGQRLRGPSFENQFNGFGEFLRAYPVFALVQSDPVQSDPVQSDQSGAENIVPNGTGTGSSPGTDTAEIRSQADASSPADANTSEVASTSEAASTPEAAKSASPDEKLNGVEAVQDEAVQDEPKLSVEESDFEGEFVVGGYDPRDIQRWGFIYLFAVESLILLRLLLDPLMVRRPLLDPNLTTGGLNFIGISLFIFMMANVVTSNPRVQVEQGPELGPGYAMMNMLPAIPTRPDSDQPGGAFPPPISELTPRQVHLTKIAKGLAILAQLAIVSGIVLISNRHFSNLRAGVGCATLYLLLPYTAQMTGRVDHALPAALLLWAVLSYRRPVLAGIFLGCAGGLVYYPLFLLPLWVSFYWQRGARRFSLGVLAVLIVMVLALWFDNSDELHVHLKRMFGLLDPRREPHEFRGIWALGWSPMWRLPVIVAFVILSSFFAIWPAQKNLGTLISGTAALMVAAQFWHCYSGGVYIAWFLPLLLLAIFRPNLQDRVASKVVTGKSPVAQGARAELEPV